MNGRQTEDIIFTSCSTTGRASWAATAPSTNQSNCSEQMRVRLQPEVKEWNVDESDNDLFISVHANVLIVYDCKIFCELRRLSVRSLQHEMTLLQSFLRFAFSLLCNVLLLRVVVDGSVSQKKTSPKLQKHKLLESLDTLPKLFHIVGRNQKHANSLQIVADLVCVTKYLRADFFWSAADSLFRGGGRC